MRKIKYIIWPLLLLALGFIVYLLINPGEVFTVKKFITSPIFGPSITLVVGSIAYVLYKKGQDDIKQDAANIILLEIENAEHLLKKASESLKIRTNNIMSNSTIQFLSTTSCMCEVNYRILFYQFFSHYQNFT